MILLKQSYFPLLIPCAGKLPVSVQRLVTDGRIHPARIEEVVEKTRKQIEEQVMEIGERTVIELGIHGLHKELVRMVGRMRFRSSYGQNLLMHSREVANLCGIMAAELGMNPKLAKRAGLLHDIGKVPDEETELSHALLGAKLAEKYGENPAVVNAIGAHHDEMEMQYVISPIIQACDAISGARPGARREIMQQYLQRIKDLENLAMTYPGVEKAYAIQAGRELRVIVEADKVTDADTEKLCFEIAQKIQNRNDLSRPDKSDRDQGKESGECGEIALKLTVDTCLLTGKDESLQQAVEIWLKLRTSNLITVTCILNQICFFHDQSLPLPSLNFKL